MTSPAHVPLALCPSLAPWQYTNTHTHKTHSQNTHATQTYRHTHIHTCPPRLSNTCITCSGSGGRRGHRGTVWRLSLSWGEGKERKSSARPLLGRRHGCRLLPKTRPRERKVAQTAAGRVGSLYKEVLDLKFQYVGNGEVYKSAQVTN